MHYNYKILFSTNILFYFVVFLAICWSIWTSFWERFYTCYPLKQTKNYRKLTPKSKKSISKKELKSAKINFNHSIINRNYLEVSRMNRMLSITFGVDSWGTEDMRFIRSILGISLGHASRPLLAVFSNGF